MGANTVSGLKGSGQTGGRYNSGFDPKVARHALEKARANQLSDVNLGRLAQQLPAEMVTLLRDIREAKREGNTERMDRLSSALEERLTVGNSRETGQSVNGQWRVGAGRGDKLETAAGLKKVKQERDAVLGPLKKAVAMAPAEVKSSLQSWAESYEKRAIDGTVFGEGGVTVRPSAEQALRDARTLLQDMKTLRPENTKEWIEAERKKLFADPPPPRADKKEPPRTSLLDDEQALIDGYAERWYDTVHLVEHHAAHLSEGMKPEERALVDQLSAKGVDREVAAAEIQKAKQKVSLSH